MTYNSLFEHAATAGSMFLTVETHNTSHKVEWVVSAKIPFKPKQPVEVAPSYVKTQGAIRFTKDLKNRCDVLNKYIQVNVA